VAGALGRGGAARREFEKMMMTAMKRALAGGCHIRSSPRKRGPRPRFASTCPWIPSTSAFTRVHSPSKTGVNALNDALCAGMNGRGGSTQAGFALVAAAAAVLLAAPLVASAQEAKPELSRVRLAVGGKPALFYLPLTVTERLGYFRDAGL